MTRGFRRLACVAALSGLLVACGSGGGSAGGESAGAGSAGSGSAGAASGAAANAGAAKQEADQIFSTRCATCHGPQGGGDGPASAGLSPKPRNFRDPAWQSSVSDQHIEQIIQFGGAAVGKSAAMPSNPDLTGKPEVVAALRLHVRALK